jgi:integrase
MARKVLVSLKSLLRDAQRRGNVAQNVALGVKRIDVGTRGERGLRVGEDFPTTEEIRLLIAALPERWRPLLLTAIFTGLRSSELRGLCWPKAGGLHVRQRADRYGSMGEPKSKAGHRTVPLAPLVLRALREWKLRCPRSDLDLVFPSRGGGIIHHSEIVKALQRAMLAAKVVDAEGRAKYTGLHSLRHFYASWCINPRDRGGQGLPPKVVQELLRDDHGHVPPPVPARRGCRQAAGGG